MLKILKNILICLIIITIGCKSAKHKAIQYKFYDHIIREDGYLILDIASREIEIRCKSLNIKVYYGDMPDENVSKLPVRLEGEKIFRSFDVLDTNTDLVWAQDICNDVFGFFEVSKLDKKNNKISGKFATKVCLLSTNDYKLIKGSFKDLDVQLIPDSSWHLPELD